MCLLQVLEVLRGIAENMVAVVNTALKCFSGMQHLLLDGDGAINLRVSGFDYVILHYTYVCMYMYVWNFSTQFELHMY